MGTFANWLLDNWAVICGWLLTIALTVAGWAITAARTRRQNEREAAASRERLDASNARIKVLEGQLEAQQQSALALSEQVDQLKEANRLFEAANPADADPWSSAVNVRGMQYRVTNEGARDVVVDTVGPDDDRLPFRCERDVPFECGAGDGFDCFVPGTNSGTASITIGWHFVGSADIRATRRPV
ncbi:hypothetical protein BACT_0520 [Bifidobacterium actinocoloniiforme DSM 22766]|uniref:Uncharacterized protein n=1 Tax=Bifidobacterium actinocoloniiforme DSM 22766 TaxID=1437605 RepID=A0A086YZW9_9BIFI|nr:bZIP transcription factor [Bifidobacterium actinocoloniiforme]AKV55099.1 hypothetical protein AB656_01205 [Bifidobacterium actinocoloniiforme DSM 22766]KFI39819.1 hypothetical protein BACT_0520 [Bifidobacterium actinocoloniiforme DSM 22766]